MYEWIQMFHFISEWYLQENEFFSKEQKEETKLKKQLMSSIISYVPNQHNKITSIVDHVLFTKSLSDHWFQWCLEQALWHIRELHLDTWQDIKTEYLPVTDRRTVLLPPCFVDWTKVGCKRGQYVTTIGVNEDLNTLDRQPNSGDVTTLQELPNGLEFNSYGGYYFFNYNGASIQSFGGGFVTKGSFKIRQTGTVKEMLLDYDYPHDYVYLEYITDGFDPCGDTVVDPYFADYVKKGIELSWEEEKSPNRTEASIYRKGQDLHYAMKVVRARKNDLDPKTLLNISRKGVRFTAKI